MEKLAKQIDALEKQIKEGNAKIADMNTRLELGDTISLIAKNNAEMDAKIAKNDVKIARLGDRLDNHEKRLNVLESRFV